MTKKEILKVLKENLEWQNYTDGNDSWDSELKEAVTEAIKLLEQPTSDDCVSRQTVLDKKVLIELPDGQSFYWIGPEDVENLPPATPTRKSGLRWVERFDNESMWLECPYCHIDSIAAYNYCPNCGASFKEKRGNKDGSN